MGNSNKIVSRLDIDSSSRLEEEDDDYGDIVIAIDSNGIKVTNRGQWLRDKWNIRKKSYLKIHVAVKDKGDPFFRSYRREST
jgi:hypothetical protein